MDGSKDAAASSSRDTSKQILQGSVDEELDFCSPNFDPLKALFSPDVIVPFENVKTFTSVKSYQDAIESRKAGGAGSASRSTSAQSNPDETPTFSKAVKTANVSHEAGQKKILQPRYKHKQIEASNVAQKAGASSQIDSEEAQVKKKSEANPEKVKLEPAVSSRTNASSLKKLERKKKRNVLTRMSCMDGPLVMLSRCVEERLHVRVMTRAAVNVRSICRGYVVAFDKLFNMALIDVDEIYRRPACLGKVRARRKYKLQTAQKTLKAEQEEQNEKFLSGDKFSSLSVNDVAGHSSTSATNSEKVKELHQGGKPGNTNSNAKQAVLNKKSIHEGVPYPYSLYEREALMLGIPDENIEHRHVNQMLIRGENVVLVSIIN